MDLATRQLLALRDHDGGLIAKARGPRLPLPSGVDAPVGVLHVFVPGYQPGRFTLDGSGGLGPFRMALSAVAERAQFSVEGATRDEVLTTLGYALRNDQGKLLAQWDVLRKVPGLPTEARLCPGLDAYVRVLHRKQHIIWPFQAPLPAGARIRFQVERVPTVRFLLPAAARGRHNLANIAPRLIPTGVAPLDWSPAKVAGLSFWGLNYRPRVVPLADGSGWSCRLPRTRHQIVAGTGEDTWYGDRSAQSDSVQMIGGPRRDVRVIVQKATPTGDVYLLPGSMTLSGASKLCRGLIGRTVLASKVRLVKGQGKGELPVTVQHATLWSEKSGVAYLRRDATGILRGKFFSNVLRLEPPEGMEGRLRVNLRLRSGGTGEIALASTDRSHEGMVSRARPLQIRGVPPGEYVAHLRFDPRSGKGTAPPREWWQTVVVPEGARSVPVHLTPQ